jgi:hypothetical protein
MKLNRRWVVLLSLLAAAAGLVLFSKPPQDAGDVVQPVARTGTAIAPAAARSRSDKAIGDAEPVMLLAIRPRTAYGPAEDMFAPHNWNPPPPPTPRLAAPPTKPTAPPIPFTLLGKKLEDGAWEVFLARQDRTYVVKAQDVIDGTYRVESIAPPSLVLTYIPLGEHQTLVIGASD